MLCWKRGLCCSYETTTSNLDAAMGQKPRARQSGRCPYCRPHIGGLLITLHTGAEYLGLQRQGDATLHLPSLYFEEKKETVHKHGQLGRQGANENLGISQVKEIEYRHGPAGSLEQQEDVDAQAKREISSHGA